MKVAFITPEYPHVKSSDSAGIGSATRNLAVALTAQNVSVVIFVYGQASDAVFVEDGVEIHMIRLIPYRIFGGYLYRKFVQSYINSLIAIKGIQIIEAADWTGLTASMRFKAPLVIRLHGSDAYFCALENRKQKLKNFILERIAMRSADAFVGPTRFAANTTRQIFGIKKNITIIPNGISIANFTNAAPGNFERGLILYFGTIIRKKGVLELPAIMKEVVKTHPDAKLLLIGTDSVDIQSNAPSTWILMQQLIGTDIKNNIEYIGKVPYQQVVEWIQKANVCVFPTFAETQGMVTIEAMAMQKAVVTSNFGWCGELIDDGISGYLADPKDHAAFAEKIVQLLNSPEIAIRIGENAQARAEKMFDINKIAAQNSAFYRTLLS